MRKITRKEYPQLFENVGEYIIKDSHNDHRRGSNFFVKSIVAFRESDQKYSTVDLSPFYGTWETNTYIRDDEYGTDWNEIDELTKVKEQTVMVPRTEWIPE